MDRNEAEARARQLMAEHRLSGWTLRWSRARRQFGSCCWDRRTLTFSVPLTELNGVTAFTDTVLHEIAHALAGPGTGHGPVWQQVCREIGAPPRRCYGDEVTTPETYRWIGRCPGCATTLQRFRLTRKGRRLACAECCRRHNGGRWSRRYQLVWTPVEPGG